MRIVDAVHTAMRASAQMGLVPVYHRFMNANTLTVAMFHRVLARHDPRWPTADPHYTLSDVSFDSCVAFLERHYHPVTVSEVLSASTGRTVLPRRALLVSFDDGWHDTLEYAAPIMRKRGLPGVVFVASRWVGSRFGFWQEELRRIALWADAMRALDDALGSCCARSPTWFDDTKRHLEHLSDEVATTLVLEAARKAPLPERPAMMSSADLRELSDHGIDVGVHGASHAPLTSIANPEAELREARETLARVLGNTTAITSMSFPHGRYGERELRAVAAAGIGLAFTSDPWLNESRKGRVSSLLGRVEVHERAISRSGDAFDDPRAMGWFFRRQRSWLGWPEGVTA